jgi:hypothetical protein
MIGGNLSQLELMVLVNSLLLKHNFYLIIVMRDTKSNQNFLLQFLVRIKSVVFALFLFVISDANFLFSIFNIFFPAMPKVQDVKIIGDLVENEKVEVTGIVTGGGTDGCSRAQWYKSFSKTLDESKLEALSTSTVQKVGCLFFFFLWSSACFPFNCTILSSLH